MASEIRRSFGGKVLARRFRRFGAFFAILPLGWVTPVKAQIGVSATLTSDYQYRGLSLSDGKPALSLNIAYDHDTGAYGGGTAIAEETAHEGVQMLGYVEYLGYSHRAGLEKSWDIGVTNQTIDKYYDEKYELNYTQAYAGFSTSHFSYYVYYSPNYFGENVSTVYLDLTGGFRPAPRLRLFGHVGVLTALGRPEWATSPPAQYDLRAGVAAEFKGGEVQLAWTTAHGDFDYLAGQPQKRAALVLSATCFF